MTRPQPITVAEAARRLGVTPRRVQDMIAAGKLPATRFGAAWQIDPRDLDRPVVRDRKGGRPRTKPAK